MTSNESFKKRVRARMARTGEKYVAARRALIEQAAARDVVPADAGAGRRWVSQPEMSDEAVRDATGRGWDEWCDTIDAWPGHVDGHTAVAAHLTDELGVDGWWAQTVTVGWERITGRRLPHQMPDGTFTASRSRTVTVDADALRATLLDEDGRDALFGGMPTALRSKPTSRSLRVGFDVGVALFSAEPRADGRVKVTVSHEKLPTYEDVELWKAHWGEWLEALDEG